MFFERLERERDPINDKTFSITASPPYSVCHSHFVIFVFFLLLTLSATNVSATLRQHAARALSRFPFYTDIYVYACKILEGENLIILVLELSEVNAQRARARAS